VRLDVVVDSAADADLALISPYNDEGAVFLYYRLLSCGLRLAATAGTDVFLSFSHGPGVASNPPGWGRVYAQLGDRGLSVAAFKEAIRAGRTVVTNGPRGAWSSLVLMCRNITTLRGLQPQATAEEIEAAARQYVRKVAGVQSPSSRTEQAVERAVLKVLEATTELLSELPPRRQPPRTLPPLRRLSS